MPAIKPFRICDGDSVVGSFNTKKEAQASLKLSTLRVGPVTKPLAEWGFKVEKLTEDGWKEAK
jgi:hypothetical protein